MSTTTSSPPPAAAPGGPRPWKRLLAIVIVVAIVVAASAGAAFLLLSQPPPPPVEATLDRVEVSAAKTTIDPLEEVVVMAHAVDSDGVDQTANVTFGAWTANPSGPVNLTGTAPAQRTVKGIAAGAVTIGVSATWKGLTRQGSMSLTVNLLRYFLTFSSSSPFVNAPVTLGVRVVRGLDTVATYLGTVHFESTDRLASLPGNTAFVPTDQGWRNFTNVIFRTAGPATVTAQDTVASITGTGALDVRRPPNAPIAAFNLTRTLMQVSVDATTSSDPDGDLATYEWDWENDGTFDATGVTQSHTYTTPGAKTVRLRVSDVLGNQDNATRTTSVATSTLDYEFHDFFNVQFGEWWDHRYTKYGDLPMNAECFNATSIPNNVCSRVTDPAVPDFSTYPYTNWYPLPGQIRPGAPNNNPMLYAGYRFNVTGRNIVGYNLSEPVFLPVLDYGAPGGTFLDFDWYMQYLDTASAAALQAAGCGRLSGQMDGFIIRSQVTLTMDLPQSKRIFGVVAADPTEAQTWWDNNVFSGCLLYGALEDAVELWFTDMGNGKYDVVNSFEFAYTPFFTDISASVDASGITTVAIDHGAWATEVLLARMFYWGNASYQANYLDSTKRAGWWGMELAWFEDFRFVGGLGPAAMDFTLRSAMQYNFQQIALPGPNGIFDKTDDVPIWTWGPILSDYTNDYTPTHLLSELDRYPNTFYGYVHSTPGAPATFYGQNATYDVVPTVWNPRAGETWHFQFPRTAIAFYDPNLTPYGADPTKGQYRQSNHTLAYGSTKPASFGSWVAQAFTWDVYGPASTGGPEGSAGPDGIPGTGDDRYPLGSWGSIRFLAEGLTLSGFGALSSSEQPSTSSTVISPAEFAATEIWSLEVALRPARIVMASDRPRF